MRARSRGSCSASRRTKRRGSRASPAVTWCRLVDGYSTHVAGRQFHLMRAVVVLDHSSPPSYSSGSARNIVTDRSVRIRTPAPGTARIAPSMCAAEELALPVAVEHRRQDAQRHGGSETNSGLRNKASRTISPSCRACGEFSGSCMFCFTVAACGPAVPRPSIHLASSMTLRHLATCALVEHLGNSGSARRRSSNENLRAASARRYSRLGLWRLDASVLVLNG